MQKKMVKTYFYKTFSSANATEYIACLNTEHAHCFTKQHILFKLPILSLYIILKILYVFRSCSSYV